MPVFASCRIRHDAMHAFCWASYNDFAQHTISIEMNPLLHRSKRHPDDKLNAFGRDRASTRWVLVFHE